MYYQEPTVRTFWKIWDYCKYPEHQAMWPLDQSWDGFVTRPHLPLPISPSPKDPERFSPGWQFNASLRRLKTYLKGTQSENEETSVSLLNALLSFSNGKRHSQERPGADNLERPVDFTSTEWMLLSIAMTFARNCCEIFEHQSQPREDKAVPTFYFPVFHSAARDTFSQHEFTSVPLINFWRLQSTKTDVLNAIQRIIFSFPDYLDFCWARTIK